MENNENKDHENDKFRDFQEFADKDNSSEKILNLPDKAFELLESFVTNIEKKQKTMKTNDIVQKAKKTEKISKHKGKISEPEPENTLNKQDLEVFPMINLKDQYTDGILIIFSFVNPLLQSKGIEPISDDEVRDLVYAIFDLFEGNIKKVIKTTETSVSYIRNIRKVLNLGKAFWNIIAIRQEKVRDILLKLKAKREVEKLEILAKAKETPK